MPIRPPSVCVEPGCTEYALPGKTRCKYHYKERKKGRIKVATYTSKRLWRSGREVYLRAHPICEMCGVKESYVIHHIVPVEDGGDVWDLDNWQALCRECHERVHGRMK